MGRRVSLLVVLGASLLAVLMMLPSAGALPPEPNYQNPVTANPPVVAPPTPSCTVPLLQSWGFDNELGQGSTQGGYAPPAGCPGPWSLVVLNWSTRVAGRQYDRLGELWVNTGTGNVEIFRTVNAEPSPAGVTWNVYKDVTEYTPVLEKAGMYRAEMDNYVFGPYTGIIYVNATLTFYDATARYPAPPTADAIVAVPNGLGTPKDLTLPQDTYRAQLEVYVTAHACDEFWYSNVPDSFLATDPYAQAQGYCGGGTFREVQATVDGQMAGVIWPFPYIYTGGINPFLWRPIPAVDTFNIPPYTLDLTPFVGRLDNGMAHTIGFSVVNDRGSWPVDASLFLWEAGTPLTGALTADTLTPNGANVRVAQAVTNLTGNPDFNEQAQFITTAARSFQISGYVNTPSGRVKTTILGSMSFYNNEVNLLSYNDLYENLTQATYVQTTDTVRGPAGTTVTSTTTAYPLVVDYGFFPTADGFILPAYVAQGKDTGVLQSRTTAAGTSYFASTTSDTVQANSTLLYSGTIEEGVNSSTSQTYLYRDTAGVYYDAYLAAMDGYVTTDLVHTNL